MNRQNMNTCTYRLSLGSVQYGTYLQDRKKEDVQVLLLWFLET